MRREQRGHVRREHGDAVARRDARAHERAREAADVLAELGPGPARVAVDDGGLVREHAHGALEEDERRELVAGDRTGDWGSRMSGRHSNLPAMRGVRCDWLRAGLVLASIAALAASAPPRIGLARHRRRARRRPLLAAHRHHARRTWRQLRVAWTYRHGDFWDGALPADA